MDNKCPWCGEELCDPFDPRELTTWDRYDRAIEAHVEECEAFLAEQGVS
jgi:hypothetical protein